MYNLIFRVAKCMWFWLQKKMPLDAAGRFVSDVVQTPEDAFSRLVREFVATLMHGRLTVQQRAWSELHADQILIAVRSLPLIEERRAVQALLSS